MKQKKWIAGAAAAALLALGLLVFFVSRPPAETFNGSRVADPDAFLLSFSAMDRTDSHTLRLESGDTLRVRYEVHGGQISVDIRAEGQEPIYRGNDVRTGSFELPIRETGDYVIRIDARRAAGSLEFQVKPGAGEEGT